MLVLLASLALAAEPALTVSVRGVGLWVGHTNNITITPSAPVDHGGSGTLRITGPHGYEVEIPVHMAPPPRRRLPACDPSPDDPHGCDDQPDFEPQGRFTGTGVDSPPWPEPGTYTVALVLASGAEVPPVTVEVGPHPLAGFVAIPKGYTVTIRSIDPFKRTVADEIVRSPSLYVCGERGHAEFCLRVTEPLGDVCPAVLAAAGAKVSWTGEGTTAYQRYDGLPATWSWCSEGRLMEIRPHFMDPKDSERWLKELFRLAPSDGLPAVP